MIFPSEPGRKRTPEDLQVELQDALEGSVRLASDDLLNTAVRMLQAQILSRRAAMSDTVLTVEEADFFARQVQSRVERIRLIAAELRRRGQAVEWEE